MASKQQAPFLDQTCHHCEFGQYQLPETGQEWHLVCDECQAILLVYEPMDHQYDFHEDPHKYRMYAGGFGSAKTSTCCADTIDHVLETPGGRTLIGANTLPQLEQTAQHEFFEMFPRELIRYHNKQKNYIITENMHQVLFRPLDDEGKARSLNLTWFWIEEGSEVGYDYFIQLQTRLRNAATDYHGGVISTNPDMSWIKSDFLLVSDQIVGSKKEYNQDKEKINPNFSTHIADTRKNVYLPPTYYEDTAKGKPEWWIERYLHGSFENREGLVYPQYSDHIVEPFKIPRHWKQRIGGDFGIVDPTAVPFLATDPKTGITYVYDEHYESGKAVKYHAGILNKKIDRIPAGRLERMVGDPSGANRNKEDMSSIFDHYAEYGIYWDPGTKKLEDRIQKMFGYFDLGRLKIFKTCKNTLYELQNYKYPERSLDKNDKTTEKPEDKHNHLMDAIGYVVFEMPDDPDQLINESYHYAETFTNSNLKEQDHLPHALRDDDTEELIDWTGY